MALQIAYTPEHRLILPPIACDCPLPHSTPDIDIFVGPGIIGQSAAYIRQKNYGPNALLVADPTTYRVAGQRVEQVLTEAGYQVKLALLERAEQLEPDQGALGEILLNLDSNIDFMVATGSGVITDLTRYTAFNTGRPFVSVATAASMDGYVSLVAPLLYNGLKVNKPATYPKTLICDLEIIRQAPYAMTVAGFGDVIGKFIAITDWILGRVVTGEDYCPICVELVYQAVQKCIANVDAIRSQSAAGIQSLVEALVLAGLTILIIGNTRPVASIEHNMAHYWDMLKLQRHETPPSHGTAVGVATGYALKFYKQFMAADFGNQTAVLHAARARRLPKETAEREVIAKYGPDLGARIVKENPDIYPTSAEQERRVAAFLENREALQKELAFLPSWEEMRQVYQRLGFPLTAAEIGIDKKLLENALICAKDYRKRYSVFNLANELGLLPELVNQVMD